MATGYSLEPGYNSAHSGHEVWKAMLEVCDSLCADPTLIAVEAKAFGCPEACPDHSEETVESYAEHYRKPWKDATIRIIETTNGDDHDNRIYQMASGGGGCRDMKEHMRRAFSRLMIREMHKRGMEVCLNVT